MRTHVARLLADGSLDANFFGGPTGPSSTVESVLPLPDGNLFIGGSFGTVDGAFHPGLARLHGDGSLDPAWYLWAGGTESLVQQPDGKILIGGAFASVSGTSQGGIARLNPNQSLDPVFTQNPGTSGTVHDVALQPDGKVLIVGTFNAVNGGSRRNVARLNANGTLDTPFQNGPTDGTSGPVYAVALQSDGKVLIGGNFTGVNGTGRNRVARLNGDGSLDTTFLNGLAGASSWIFSVLQQPDGKVLVGGAFTTFNGASRNRIARLNADGSLDTTFQAIANGDVRVFALLPDGRILVGGDFTTMNGVARGRIARLYADGSLDTTFGNLTTGADRAVHTIEIMPDGRLMIAGEFTIVDGVGRAFVARLHGEHSLPPQIATEPADQTSYAGCCAVFRVAATGTPLAYRWRKHGVDLVDTGSVSGSATATLRVSDLTAADEGAYSVVVSNSLGSEISNDALLTLASLPACRVLSCDEASGCQLSLAAEGTSCSDGDACTTEDRCTGGACAGVSGPAEVDAGVRLDGTGGGDVQIRWNLAAGADSSDVLRGSALPVGSGAGEVCLASALPSDVLTWIDATVPGARSSFWYLVRGRSACGNGSYGFEARNGTPTAPRVTSTCP